MSIRTPEQRAHDLLRKHIKGRWTIQRHEDRYSSGIPDISYVHRLGCGWIELKADSKIRMAQAHWLCDRAYYPHFSGFIVKYSNTLWTVCKVCPEDRHFLLKSQINKCCLVLTTKSINDLIDWIENCSDMKISS